jgi:hypothetical protein
MVYCPKCNDFVDASEQSTLRSKGMCTACYLHSLPAVPEQRRQAAELDARAARQVRSVA